MCRISFNLEITIPNNESNYTVTGRYKLVNSIGPWYNFDVGDINFPSIFVKEGLGDYEMQLFVELGSGIVAQSPTEYFSVTSDCGGDPTVNYDCNTVKFEKYDTDSIAIVNYIDCNGVEKTYDETQPDITFYDGSETFIEDSPFFIINCVGQVKSVSDGIKPDFTTRPTPDYIPCGRDIIKRIN